MSRSHTVISFITIMFVVLGAGVLVNILLSGFDKFGPAPASSFIYLIALYTAILIPTAAAIIAVYTAINGQWAGYIYILASLVILTSSLHINEVPLRDGIGLLLIYSIGILMFSLYYLAGVFGLLDVTRLRS